MTITIEINIKFEIINIPHYGFGNDNNCYNLKSGRKIKQCYNNGSIGYWFGRKFYSLKAIRPLLYKPSKFKCPF
jgi:hypothetical protein